MTPTFVDTHCHFDFDPFFGNEEESLRLAAAAGVEKIIGVGVSADRFAGVMALAEKWPPLYAALGTHPMAIAQHDESHLEQLETYLKLKPNKLVAIGEIGLDLFIDDPQFEKQERVLAAQIRLAKQYDLPVILHSRRTHDKLALHLRRLDLPRRGVVHGLPAVNSRRWHLSAQAMPSALAAPSPMSVPVKPVMPSHVCR